MNRPAHGSARYDLWAPKAGSVTLLADGQQYPMSRRGPEGEGWWTAAGAPAAGDVDYGYLVDGDSTPLPDPRSRRQPAGVHALSRTFDAAHFDPAVHRSDITTLADGSYAGVVETVDPFNGSRPLKLHLEGENVTCGARRGFVVSLSPHTPGDAVWKALSSNRHTFACTKPR